MFSGHGDDLGEVGEDHHRGSSHKHHRGVLVLQRDHASLSRETSDPWSCLASSRHWSPTTKLMALGHELQGDNNGCGHPFPSSLRRRGGRQQGCLRLGLTGLVTWANQFLKFWYFFKTVLKSCHFCKLFENNCYFWNIVLKSCYFWNKII